MKAVEAAPTHPEARALLARIRAALDEREDALANFRAVLELTPAPPEDPAGTPVHLALHNLEQLIYLEQLHGLPLGTLLPMTAGQREETRRRFNQILDNAGSVAPRVKLSGDWGRALAEPPRTKRNEPAPDRCLNPRNDGAEITKAFRDSGGVACVDNLLAPAALAQHQRPGTDIHADQSDISLNFWITPDSANLAPDGGGPEMWNVTAPPDWTFNDYNADGYRIRLHLSQIGARQRPYPYSENRGLLFKGMLFHETSSFRFAEGFENRRRNITMLLRRGKSR